MKRILYTLALVALLVPTTLVAQPQNPRAQNNDAKKTDTPKTDEKKEDKGPAKWSDFIKAEAQTMENGMTPVYVQDKKYYIGIPDSLLGRDILMVTRIAECPAGFRSDFFGYAGDQLNSGMFRFEKGPDDNIFFTKVLAREVSKDSTQAMYANVVRSNKPAIIFSFPIKAQNDDKTLSLIDITDVVKGDNETLYFSKAQKRSSKIGALQGDKSYVESVKTFPINTELRSVKTFAQQDANDPITFTLNCSLVLLPKEPMQPRLQDDRVGYFAHNYTSFDENPQGIKTTSMIARWRLEPKPEDLEKYKSGQLVEPAKPIVYYIDPTTPPEWIPYLIQGVNDWQPAFEKAGFKNAIYARVAPTPEEDPSWSLEDARHSAIVYKPSTIANASGPHVSDPRSGEIIESHVNWYHNVMSLVHNWYFVQCAAVDPQARTMEFPQELMGQLIRFVSSHEVGHTLGLRHNFGATAYYTTAQLRDPDFIRANGHTTSIMDYSRFNFVAQPEDNFTQDLLFPRISHYDLWAIEWGYRRFYQYPTAQAEQAHVNKWVIEKTANPYLKFNGGSESGFSDPRAQSEDLGDNQMETCELGIKNLKVILANLPEWTRQANEDYSSLGTMLLQIVSQYGRYMGHVAAWVGGVYTDKKKVEEDGPIWVPVEKERQQEAMAFLNKHLFNAPTWLLPSYTHELLNYSALSMMENQQQAIIGKLVSANQLYRMLRVESYMGTNTYTIENMFNDLNTYIFNNYGATDMNRRSLQKIYVNALINLVKPQTTPGEAASMRGGMRVNMENNDLKTLVTAQLNTLEKGLKKAGGDTRTKAHYQFLYNQIADLHN